MGMQRSRSASTFVRFASVSQWQLYGCFLFVAGKCGEPTSRTKWTTWLHFWESYCEPTIRKVRIDSCLILFEFNQNSRLACGAHFLRMVSSEIAGLIHSTNHISIVVFVRVQRLLHVHDRLVPSSVFAFPLFSGYTKGSGRADWGCARLICVNWTSASETLRLFFCVKLRLQGLCRSGGGGLLRGLWAHGVAAGVSVPLVPVRHCGLKGDWSTSSRNPPQLTPYLNDSLPSYLVGYIHPA